MFKKNVAVVLLALSFGPTFALADQEQSEQPPHKREKETKYEKFLDRTGVFVLSRSYEIGRGKVFGSSVLAMVAWALGEPDRVYAARISGAVVDYDELKDLRQELDKIIQTLDSSIDNSDWSTMRYQSLNGLELNFLPSVEGDRRFLNLTYRGKFIASGEGRESLLQLRDLNDLIAKVRERLIALGAK